jgi:hypothetical protein
MKTHHMKNQLKLLLDMISMGYDNFEERENIDNDFYIIIGFGLLLIFSIVVAISYKVMM